MRTPASLDNTDAPSATYAHGNIRDDAVPGDLTGTPMTREWLGDIYHGSLEIIDRAGITPSEAAETSLASDLADAIDAIHANAATITVGDLPLSVIPDTLTGKTAEYAGDASTLDSHDSTYFGTAANEDILLDFRSYDATRTYALNDPVFYNGAPYKSLQNSNVGNTPASSPTYWEAQGGSAIPVGAGMEWYAATAPTGWLLQDGSAVSRTTYAALFSVIGTTWGVGDGSTTFNLPDKREAASVGIGTRASGVTAHDAFTLAQFKDDQYQEHLHSAAGVGGVSGNTVQSGVSYASSTPTGTSITDTVHGTPRTGDVTRGKRIGVNFIIKY